MRVSGIAGQKPFREIGGAFALQDHSFAGRCTPFNRLLATKQRARTQSRPGGSVVQHRLCNSVLVGSIPTRGSNLTSIIRAAAARFDSESCRGISASCVQRDTRQDEPTAPAAPRGCHGWRSLRGRQAQGRQHRKGRAWDDLQSSPPSSGRKSESASWQVKKPQPWQKSSKSRAPQ